MATKVLDSWALLAFFQDEPAAATVEQFLIKAETGKVRLLLCVINWGEIYYSIMRRVSRDAAEQSVAAIAEMPIEIVPVENDLMLVRQAAMYKATKKLSYADAFAAALTKLRNAELVTGDKEFREVENDIKIAWLS